MERHDDDVVDDFKTKSGDAAEEGANVELYVLWKLYSMLPLLVFWHLVIRFSI